MISMNNQSNKRSIPLDEFVGVVEPPEKKVNNCFKDNFEYIINNEKVDAEINKRILEDGELPDELEKTVTTKTNITEAKPNIVKEFKADFSRKRKVALLLAYCGANYSGMQKNPDVETIEEKLLDALCEMKAIRAEHKHEFLVNNVNQISFQRAARTDKGVSAARQTVSLKLVASNTFLEDVNKLLPDDIRVFGLERVTKSFNAKCCCSGRAYEYLVPSFAFAPSNDVFSPSYRISDEQFAKLNRLFSCYEGTHNFHNFTSGKPFSDQSANRYIISFKANKPFECQGHEFIAIEISGQSFMIHQIRKMIGLVIAVCRGHCPEDTIEKSWLQAKADIPKAPGLGLLLCKVFYNHYNEKHCNDGLHKPITWSEQELEVERFKIEHIWYSIINEEIKKSPMVTWLKTLVNHTYTKVVMKSPMPSDYKGKNGVFPEIEKVNS
nr:tRNA pseudouridine synthase A [Hydra vulgaris]